MNLISNTFSHFWTMPQLNPTLAMIFHFLMTLIYYYFLFVWGVCGVGAWGTCQGRGWW